MALGDIICTFPAAHQLKKRHPGAAFIYHCRQDYACLPRMGGVTAHTISNLNLRRMEATYAFLFAGIYKFTYGDEFENKTSTESVIAEHCRQHGVPICDAHPQLQIAPAALAKARQVLESLGLDKTGPVIAIHPGPSWPVREWPGESWARLVQALNRHGLNNLIQLGTGKAGEVGAALNSEIPGVLSLVNKLTIEESIALISCCNLFIGIDSGLLHAAASVQTPVVGIFGATSPQLRFSKARAKTQVTSKAACQGCHHRVPRLHWINGCPYDIACMKTICVEDVLRACLSKLDYLNSPAAPPAIN